MYGHTLIVLINNAFVILTQITSIRVTPIYMHLAHAYWYRDTSMVYLLLYKHTPAEDMLTQLSALLRASPSIFYSLFMSSSPFMFSYENQLVLIAEAIEKEQRETEVREKEQQQV